MNQQSVGTTQTERLTNIVSSSDVSVIDTSETEFLNFIQDFSNILHYWNDQGNIEGTWAPFFQSDTSFILADISRYDIGVIKRKSHKLKKKFFSTYHRDQQEQYIICLLYTSPSPRDKRQSRMPSSA